MTKINADKASITVNGKYIDIPDVQADLTSKLTVDYAEEVRKALLPAFKPLTGIMPENESNQLNLFPAVSYSDHVKDIIMNAIEISLIDSLSIYRASIIPNSATIDQLDATAFNISVNYQLPPINPVEVIIHIDDPCSPPVDELCECGKGKHGFDSHSPWCLKGKNDGK